jgi:endonuclease/exonuclease/phosphatase family metal-dependent hydrolase
LILEKLQIAYPKRAEQAKIIMKHIENSPYPVIVCGDFNDTPISYAVNNMLSGGLINSFREKGSGLGITYNGDFPNFQIDYILVSPSFSVKNYRIIQKKVSDHYALRSDLELQ